MKIKKIGMAFLFIIVSALCVVGGLFACSRRLSECSAPVNVYMDEYSVLHWDMAENAVEYAVSINGKEYYTEENSLDIFGLTDEIGEYEIKVKSFGILSEFNDSDWSDAVYYSVEGGFKNMLAFTLLEDETGYEVRARSADISGKVIIPAEFAGKPVVRVAEYAFSRCDGITGIVIPDGVTIGKWAFSYCGGLMRVKFPCDLIEIPMGCFSVCGKLDRVELPDSVEKLCFGAFMRCLSLSDIKFGMLKEIGNGAFEKVGLKELRIPSTVEKIHAGNPFAGNDLEKITVDPYNNYYTSEGNCLIEISSGAVIAGCKNSVIPKSAKSLGDQAFRDCRNLKTIVIPGNIARIPERAFFTYLCEDMLNLDSDLKDDLTDAELELTDEYATLSELVISEGVEEIGGGFNYCQIKELYIPSTVKKIIAFTGCDKLESLTVSEDNSVYMSDGNCIVEKETDKMIWGCQNSVIPDYVTSVGGFSGCKQLKSIVIPDGVIEIANYAFCYCISLETVLIPRSVKRIGFEAFADTNIKDGIVLSKEIEYIGQNAFIANSIYTDYECCGASIKESYPGCWGDTMLEGAAAAPNFIKATKVSTIVFDCGIEYDDAGYPFVNTFTYKTYDVSGIIIAPSMYRSSNVMRLFGVSSFEYLVTSGVLYIPLTVPARVGYVFCGWATEKDGEVVYPPVDTDYGTETLVDSQTETLEDGAVLYAIWQKQ